MKFVVLKLYCLYFLVTGFEEQACTLRGISLVSLHFHGVPVDLIRTLCERGMGNQRTVTDNRRDLVGLDDLLATLIDLPVLRVNPLALREIHRAAVA